MFKIQVYAERFDTGKELDALSLQRTDIGALASFVGYVRDFNERPDVTALTLEHYPGMTEQQLQAIAETAAERWPLLGGTIIHRIGRMEPGDPIVLVAVASAHRQAAFDACNFIMDYLKTRAPFWKKEHTLSGDYWVSSRPSDSQAAQRWDNNND
ncbi:molybdopterin synthase catalytic subunit MoaE [Nitrincola sp.]|uniref:molybdopterin synthase catalytic subunit MoaE n=1 Tax=Nitrincola sp. TaxID=1926584 RepID=UPI003A8F0F3B